MNGQDSREYAIAVNGIGGQGVQLIAKVFARAMLDAGAHVLLTSQYGGEMRGGRSFAGLAVGDGPIGALPVLDRANCVLALHSAHWAEIDALLLPDGFVIAEAEFAPQIVAAVRPTQHVVAVPARQAAIAVGNPMGAGIALLGAFCVSTGLAPLAMLSRQLANALPVYRRQYIEGNERALFAGAEALPAGVRTPLPLQLSESAAS